jgi:hypothetical protein
MKQVILLLSFTAMATFAAAQAGDPVAELRGHLKNEVKLNPTQIDSVVAIQLDYQKATAKVAANKDLSEDARKVQLKPFKDGKYARLNKILTKDQVDQAKPFLKEALNKLRGTE